MGRSMEIRSQRDPVLAEAIRLLGDARTQSDLFAAQSMEGDKGGDAGEKPRGSGS